MTELERLARKIRFLFGEAKEEPYLVSRLRELDEICTKLSKRGARCRLRSANRESPGFIRGEGQRDINAAKNILAEGLRKIA